MSGAGWLPAPAEELFGAGATAEESYAVLTVDVPADSWVSALLTARDTLGCTYFDWLSAVDEPGTGLRIAAHVVALAPVRRLLVRTTVPHERPVLPTAVEVYAGAAWHERETHEMFGVDFAGHPALDHLLLPDTFEGHPLRKDFVLAARVAKAWPGAKEPGESDHGGPKRRQMLPPGVPDPNEWGPLKGTLPAAPARPARGAARPAGERPVRTPGDRPVRRTRTAAGGSASQTSGDTGTGAGTGTGTGTGTDTAEAGGAEPPATPGAAGGATAGPRRMRSASQGSASQTAAAGTTPAAPAGPVTPETPTKPETPASPASPRSAPRRSRSASGGSASQRAEQPAPPPPPAPAADPVAQEPQPQPQPPTPPRSADAPWHHARPAFDEPESPGSPESPVNPESPETPQQPPAPPTPPAPDDDPEGDQR
ncbi:NADH-quinone oxidoreductase subunit C [Streptomyces sp. NPDC018057]|uniref:NADH-quinone oxidoreductase subunit C n=1 Tax=unclassified Streptomyces TaxID=2593676 RepID=UPI0037BA3830